MNKEQFIEVPLEWLEDKSPFENNRIVNDITFALRLKNFVEKVNVNDICSSEEKEYLLNIANELLNYQIKTVKDDDEIKYLKNNNLL